MLSGSTVLRISLLLIVAGCLAALIQYSLPHGGSTAVAPSAVAPAPRTVTPAPRQVGPPPLASAPTLSRATEVDSAPAPNPTPAPQPTVSAPAPVAPAPSSELRPAAPEPVAPQPTGQAEVDEAVDTAGPRALTLVDINTASLAELNGLRGGGSIGRAIIQRRPYASIDQLLSKRVLSRATYDKIKDQITVR